MGMEAGRTSKRVILSIQEGTRPRGTPRKRWEDGVVEDAPALVVRNWREEVMDRVDWRPRPIWAVAP